MTANKQNADFQILTVPVQLPGREYDVNVGDGILPQLGARTAAVLKPGPCALVTDSNVGPLYSEAAASSLQESGFAPTTITVPAGEPSKSMHCVEDVCRQMIRAGLDRGSSLVALGGGVVGDLAGFVAAVFYRGIPFVQVPTSVLAQVDSSVGGKTGVNAPEGKNLIGAFHQPKLVLADTEVFSTLPEREYNEGYAEIIKHAAIRRSSMLEEVIALKDRNNLARLIASNVAIKATVVEEDEKETSGTRALLNFGHTIGHAIESAAKYGTMLHGEAISLGMLAAARLSERVSGFSPDSTARIRAALEHFGLPLTLPPDITTDDINERLYRDKKFVGGAIRFVLLRELGDAFVSSEVTPEMITEEIERLR